MTDPVVIIGAGPAGLSCARTLAAQGIKVLVIEDNLQAGGQYFRQLPPGYTAAANARLLREGQRGQALIASLNNELIRFLPATTAWSLPEPGVVAWTGPGETGRSRARAIVIATGARDAPFPFPGWVLPGVISAGGCLNLAKGQGLVPPGPIVVAGNGPLVLVAAATLAAAGANVTHVVEAQGSARVGAAMIGGATEAPGLIRKGIGYRLRLMRHGTTFLSGQVVSRASGRESVERVEIRDVARTGAAAAAAPRILEARTLVLGYGLLPGSESFRQAGCRMIQDPDLGGLVPERSATFETSVSRVYGVGDAAGIGGVEVALLEGEIAALAIAGKDCESLRRRYRRLDRFRRRLTRAYRPEQPLSSADDETIICRCEDLRLGELRAAFLAGDSDLNRLKAETRLGMGRCQGRNCLHSAAKLLLPEGSLPDPFPRMRPPVRPVRLGDLIKDTSGAPAREPDEAAATSPR